MNSIEKIDNMISILKSIKSDIKKLEKLSAKDFSQMTDRQISNRNADADWICMDLIKRRHELHALAVELDFAERRDNYNAIELRDNWHVFNYKPREPN